MPHRPYKRSGTASRTKMDQNDDIQLISSAVKLPTGVVVPNRLVKASMEEGIGFGGGPPGAAHRRLYSRWAEGGWGIIITGNAQVDPRHLATPHDLTIGRTPKTLKAFTELHHAISSKVPPDSFPPLCLVQISHAGLQSSPTINLSRAPWTPALGPCSARPDMGTRTGALGWLTGRLIWPIKSRVVDTVQEWEEIIGMFRDAAELVEQAGWDGVQVHSAHGYLLAEYLSPLTNPNPQPLPGVPDEVPLRLHLLYLVLKAIHSVTSGKFIKAVKVNCSDFVQGGLDEKQSADIVKEIVRWKSVDILEISGGTYSSPAFARLDVISPATSPSPRQALFHSFATSVIPHLPSPPDGPAILLTGGLHSRELIASSIRERACDLAGIGRPACMDPILPSRVILNPEVKAEEATIGGYTIPGGEFWKYWLGGGRASPEGGVGVGVATYADADTAGDENTPLMSSAERKSRDRNNTGGIPLVGAGISTFWHEWQLTRMSRGADPDPSMGWMGGGALREGLWWGVFGGGPVGWWRAAQGT